MSAVVLSDEGIAHACIGHTDSQIPTLQALHHSPVTNKSGILFSLKKFVEKYNLIKTKIVTTLLIADSNLVMLERPDVAEDELAQAVRWNIKDSFNFNIDDAIVDVFEIPQQKERGRTPLIYVTAAKKSFLKQRIALLEEQELEVDSIDIAELVLRNVATLLPEDEQGVVLLKLDATQGLMTLTQNSTLYLARKIDIGYSALITSVEQGVDSLSLEQQNLLDSIVLEVQRSLDYYESHFAKPSIHSLVIAPLEHEIPHITKYLSDALGMNVRVFDFNTILDTPKFISNEMQEKCFFAIGAALRQFNLSLNSQKNGLKKGKAA